VSAGGHDAGALLSLLVAVILATKLLGEGARRLGQPAVLGEMLAGILLGSSVLGLLVPGDPVITALAEIGVVILLFEIGLHTDLRALGRVAGQASAVALAGVAVPFALGYFAMRALGVAELPAFAAGAALTATSIGISARVLGDLGRLDTTDGQVVLGAAVLDDIAGLVILSVVAATAQGAEVSAGGILRTVAVALGFLAIAIVLGRATAPPVFRLVERLRSAGGLGLVALAFAFMLAAAADHLGSALIMGAFAAGLVLHPTAQRAEIEKSVTTIGHFFVPFFFASVGASVDLNAAMTPDALRIGAALIAVGVLGKLVSGWAPHPFTGNRLLVGVAMVPRGEVGLIFAQTSLAAGAISPSIFGAIMLMVLVTTFVTPPVLARVARTGSPRPPSGDQPGDGGIDDLVYGWGTPGKAPAPAAQPDAPPPEA